jgi:hypothetical protein
MAIKRKITVTSKDGTQVQLTPQQKAYADIKQQNPTMALSQVAHRAYPTAQPNTLRQLVNQNERNTNIAIYSGKQVEDAKTLVHSIVNNPESKDRDRLTASIDILNREYGTPRQVIESSSTKLILSIDLTTSDDITDGSTTQQ